jgi:hypothetical protein
MERWVLLLGSCCRKEMAELPPAATLSLARATPASPVIALWPRAELAAELPPQPTHSEAFDADRDHSSDETVDSTRRLLDSSQYEELLRWPQLHAAVQRALRESAAYADGHFDVAGWRKLQAPTVDRELEALATASRNGRKNLSRLPGVYIVPGVNGATQRARSRCRRVMIQ